MPTLNGKRKDMDPITSGSSVTQDLCSAWASAMITNIWFPALRIRQVCISDHARMKEHSKKNDDVSAPMEHPDIFQPRLLQGSQLPGLGCRLWTFWFLFRHSLSRSNSSFMELWPYISSSNFRRPFVWCRCKCGCCEDNVCTKGLNAGALDC